MRNIVFAALTAAFYGFIATSAAFAGEEGAKRFAINLADRAIEILQNDNLSNIGQQRELQDLFQRSADLDWVARFVLGKHWRTASDEQKKSYLTHYKTFIVKNFSDRLGSYKGQDYTIRQARQDGEPNEYLLTLEVRSPGEPNAFLDYRIRKEGSHYRIFDIIVEGVSLITTQRSEFNSVIDREGLDYLISALEKRSKG